MVQSRKTIVACKIADAFTNENYNSHFCLHYIHHLIIQVHTSLLCIWIQCCVPNEETCNLLCSIGHVVHINFASICEWMCTWWVWNINWSRTRCDVFHFRKSGKTSMTVLYFSWCLHIKTKRSVSHNHQWQYERTSCNFVLCTFRKVDIIYVCMLYYLSF